MQRPFSAQTASFLVNTNHDGDQALSAHVFLMWQLDCRNQVIQEGRLKRVFGL
jgi:hypothetical protein